MLQYLYVGDLPYYHSGIFFQFDILALLVNIFLFMRNLVITTTDDIFHHMRVESTVNMYQHGIPYRLYGVSTFNH